ncbi:MAG: hypothetical protein ABI857_04670 [Acidobacteriota bacterium]
MKLGPIAVHCPEVFLRDNLLTTTTASIGIAEPVVLAQCRQELIQILIINQPNPPRAKQIHEPAETFSYLKPQ